MLKREVTRHIVLVLCLGLLVFSAAYALEEVAAGTVAEYNSQHSSVEAAAIATEHGTISAGFASCLSTGEIS